MITPEFLSPTRVVVLVPIPDHCHLLFRFLDVKHREIDRRQHATKWPLVLKAMEEQFTPSIRHPLDVAETLRLAEEEVARDRTENINHFAGLAALNAYLGNVERALHWCSRLEDRAAHIGRPLGDWEVRKREYALALRQAIDAGTHREVLVIK